MFTKHQIKYLVRGNVSISSRNLGLRSSNIGDPDAVFSPLLSSPKRRTKHSRTAASRRVREPTRVRDDNLNLPVLPDDRFEARSKPTCLFFGVRHIMTHIVVGRVCPIQSRMLILSPSFLCALVSSSTSSESSSSSLKSTHYVRFTSSLLNLPFQAKVVDCS
jgi:hypothetical protein